MSAPGRFGEGLAGDPAMLGFVDWLTTRTNNGLVRWENKSKVISAKLLGPLLAEFVIVSTPEGPVWTEFTIHDDEGKEVFRAYPHTLQGKSRRMRKWPSVCLWL